MYFKFLKIFAKRLWVFLIHNSIFEALTQDLRANKLLCFGNTRTSKQIRDNRVSDYIPLYKALSALNNTVPSTNFCLFISENTFPNEEESKPYLKTIFSFKTYSWYMASRTVREFVAILE